MMFNTIQFTVERFNILLSVRTCWCIYLKVARSCRVISQVELCQAQHEIHDNTIDIFVEQKANSSYIDLMTRVFRCVIV